MESRSLVILLLSFAFLRLPLLSIASDIVTVRDSYGRTYGRATKGYVLVKFKSGASNAQKSDSIQEIGAEKEGEIPAIGWTLLKLPPDLTLEQALEHYKKNSAVSEVQPNYVYRPLLTPNDALVNQQYGLSSINAFGAWEFEVGNSSAVTIAVIDTGVDGTHLDLDVGSKVDHSSARSYNTVTGAAAVDAPTDSCGHGTVVAGVAAAASNNTAGVAGVSWGAKILSLRVFDSGCDTTSDITLSSAVAYAVQRATSTGTRMVINLSLGGCPPDDGTFTPCVCSSTLSDAMNLALANNIVVVAAGGNQGSGNVNKYVECPAKISGVMAVGATDSASNVTSFSAVGPELDVTAPGLGVTGTKNGGGYEFNANGTSFAAPHVAGLAALILSALPTATTIQVIDFIQNSADDFGSVGFDASYGFGRVNAYRALRLVSRGTLSDFKGEEAPIAFPNPFRVSTQGRVSFGIPQSLLGSSFEIKIYDISGDLVKTLSTLSWDGKNDSGQPVASGVYIYLVKSGRGQAKGRLALIR
ncbi:MAG: S8 family serine peptidase [Elusimicrobia bacterium]|nr:S8 family serine peptidase [Elusimicrobiota bacterium]